MIDQAKLDTLSLDTLMKLKSSVQEAITRKQVQYLRPGGQAEFHNDKIGKTVRIYVQRVNAKSVTGYEIDDNGIHLTHRRWRVGPSLLKPLSDRPANTVSSF